MFSKVSASSTVSGYQHPAPMAILVSNAALTAEYLVPKAESVPKSNTCPSRLEFVSAGSSSVVSVAF